jgi:hypothetical protein
MTPKFAKAAAALFLCALTASASANPGQGFTWSFQTTSLNAPSSNTNLAMMMRNGLAWPLVVTDYSSPTGGGYGSSSSLFPTTGPVGAPTAGSHWQNIGSGFFSTTPNRLRSASSPDGRVAFAASDFSGGLGGRVSSVSGGWGALPAGTKAVAFDANGTLYTATNTAVSGVGGYSGQTIVDMAVSPNGEVGVVSSDMKFWQYSAWLGSWTSATLPTVGTTPLSDSYDVEFDSFGRPHVIASASNTLVAWDFNTVTGNWSATTLATFSSGPVRATLAANTDGTVGTAWVDPAGSLVYAYKSDLNNWATSVVTSTGFTSGSIGQVGISYDYADLPVLAYRTTASPYNVMVAYDPIVVPEPAGVALAAVAACALAARRRTA